MTRETKSRRFSDGPTVKKTETTQKRAVSSLSSLLARGAWRTGPRTATVKRRPSLKAKENDERDTVERGNPGVPKRPPRDSASDAGAGSEGPRVREPEVAAVRRSGPVRDQRRMPLHAFSEDISRARTRRPRFRVASGAIVHPSRRSGGSRTPWSAAPRPANASAARARADPRRRTSRLPARRALSAPSASPPPRAPRDPRSPPRPRRGRRA